MRACCNTETKDVFCDKFLFLIYSLFHKTLPRSTIQMHWISARFYEMGVRLFFLVLVLIICNIYKNVRTIQDILRKKMEMHIIKYVLQTEIELILHTVNYPKYPFFSQYKTRYCAYIHRVKITLLKNL